MNPGRVILTGEILELNVDNIRAVFAAAYAIQKELDDLWIDLGGEGGGA